MPQPALDIESVNRRLSSVTPGCHTVFELNALKTDARALERERDFLSSEIIKGTIAIFEGNGELASGIFESLLEGLPDEPYVHANYAAVLAMQGDLGKSLEFLKSAVVLSRKELPFINSSAFWHGFFVGAFEWLASEYSGEVPVGVSEEAMTLLADNLEFMRAHDISENTLMKAANIVQDCLDSKRLVASFSYSKLIEDAAGYQFVVECLVNASPVQIGELNDMLVDRILNSDFDDSFISNCTYLFSPYTREIGRPHAMQRLCK